MTKTVIEFADHRCPRCGSTLLTDGAYIWCSFVGGRNEKSCAYGLDEHIHKPRQHIPPPLYEQITLRLAHARGDAAMDDTGRFLMMWILENIDTSQDVEVGMVLALAKLTVLVEQIMQRLAE